LEEPLQKTGTAPARVNYYYSISMLPPLASDAIDHRPQPALGLVTTVLGKTDQRLGLPPVKETSQTF